MARGKITRKIDSECIVKFLNVVFSREGLTFSILSDNGVKFTSNETKTYLNELGVRQKFTSLYHPQTNGVVERFNRVLKESVKIAKSQGLDWKEVLLQRVEIYRFTPHSSTGKTPFELSRGRIPNTELAPYWVGELRSGKQEEDKSNWRQKEEKIMEKRKKNMI